MAGKKVLIVYAHQEPRSFNGSLKDVAVAELSRQGCTITVSDLYAMDFEPRATRKDITGALSSPDFFSYGVEAYEACKKRSLTSDIIAEQKKVQEADLVMFQGFCGDRSGLQGDGAAGVWNLRSRLLRTYPSPTPRCVSHPRAGKRADSFPHPRSGPVAGAQHLPARSVSGKQSGTVTGDAAPAVTATSTLSALPAPPAVTATPRASEKGEKPPRRVADTCLPGPGRRLPRTPGRERGSGPSAPCLPLPQFPLYWFSVPAVLKGWMDRVLCQGFAFDLPGFYDDGLLKGKLAILSLTTGGTADMYWKTGASGDFRYFLWPLQHGTLHFCGFKVLAPHISFAPEFASEEERRGMVASWAQRLKTIWKEEPIPCWPPWYFGQ
ncbi:ribosyldihydronicotinamide dehydrogenase [quinone] isoform X1 [Balaenoptera ricei]|uniref:ribosyldihydronicotinamide dehydrogenase [quinone] isoform X1 n=1 Tax=Balaenoptera ricei TaxID=2746895 RepID=UPI0028BF0452|nr:ribosyldihydronicotinamide dehydrogenase [quinone] isoform X1 [Balaenoptera ricei]